MKSTAAQNPSQSEAAILQASKNKYCQLGIDLRVQADLAMVMGIVGSMQREIQVSFDRVEQKPQVSEEVMDVQLARCVKCSEQNHRLLLRVLQVKEELVGRMFMSQVPSKHNQTRLDGMLAEIRRAKLQIKEQVRELQIRKVSLASRPKPFQNEMHLDDKDLGALCNGLELLQRETFDLWKELTAYSLPDRPIRIE